MTWDVMPPDYYVGLDLGQRKDFSALSVVECPIWVNPRWHPGLALPDGWISPAEYHPNARDAMRAMEQRRGGLPHKPVLQVRQLLRFPLHTGYPDIVDYVAKLLEMPPLNHGTVLLVDATGVGLPVVDLFRLRGLRPIAITITGGRDVSVDPSGREYGVPKRDLISATQVAFQADRLKIAEGLPEANTLVRELLDFRVKITAAAHDSYGAWREGSHDDLVLALALAVWYREWWNTHLDAGLVNRGPVAAQTPAGQSAP